MESIVEGKVGDLVAEDHRAAAIFERFSIDFCCNGGRTIAAACAERGVSPGEVIQELKRLGPPGEGALFRPADLGLEALADFIMNNHHRYVRRMLPVITAHLEKTVAAHGTGHPELARIMQFFRAVAGELQQHMQKEEMILFPYIHALAAAKAEGHPLPQRPFGSIRNPIRMMEHEHQSAGNALHSIRDLSREYTPPPDACTTYRVTYQELREFEQDLHQHIHLENNILFPNAIELEASLTSAG